VYVLATSSALPQELRTKLEHAATEFVMASDAILAVCSGVDMTRAGNYRKEALVDLNEHWALYHHPDVCDPRPARVAARLRDVMHQG